MRLCIENHCYPTGEVIAAKPEQPIKPSGGGPNNSKESIYDQFVKAMSRAA